MRVLVTGSEGFLGRHLLRTFADLGHEVFGYDVKNGPEEDCRLLFATGHEYDEKFDLVIHAAAVVGGRAKIDGDPLALAENLELDAQLFRWVTRTRQPHLVYLSSSAVYPTILQGANSTHRLREVDQRPKQSIGVPDQVYGWSKLVGEALAVEARRAGTRVDVVRPFSGYGADQDKDYPFRAFLERALDRANPFRVWGDPTSTRDWVHVDDVCGAIAAIVDQDNPYDVVNVCTGRATSFRELATIFLEEAGHDAEVESLRTAPQGVMHRVGDPSRMLGFYRPQVTLERGVRRALREARS